MAEVVEHGGRPWFERDGATTPDSPHGGLLDFRPDGIAGCVGCGWRGVPSSHGVRYGAPLFPFVPLDPFSNLAAWRVRDRVLSTFCPVCERPMLADDALRAEPKAGRNQPCTCGSGRKYKKCCGR